MSWIRVGNYDVSPDYLYPVTIGGGAALAAQNDCVLPTPELVDQIWQQADLKLAPHPRSFKLWTMAEMNSPTTNQAQASYIRQQIDGYCYDLLAGTHKDIVQDEKGTVGIYGWHDLTGKPLQPFYAGHALSWGDYSQGVRLCRKVSG